MGERLKIGGIGMIEGQIWDWIRIEGVVHTTHAIAWTPFAGNMMIAETIFEISLLVDHMRIPKRMIEGIGGTEMKC